MERAVPGRPWSGIWGRYGMMMMIMTTIDHGKYHFTYVSGNLQGDAAALLHSFSFVQSFIHF
jgi:hypothetical protein